jgi:c-di-GMP-binding flagellar brake protein YcgR
VAEIVSVEPPDRRRSLYRAHARFVDLERGVEERIVRFIFREQRLMQRMRAA